MSEHENPRMTTPVVTGPGSEAEDDSGISLKPLLDVIVAYRRVITLAIVSAVTLAALAVVTLGLVLPTERTATIEFRLLFDGAAENKYPNDSPFNPAELVDTSVLNEVYRTDDLQRFGPYEDFKSSMAVLSASPERDQLDLDYASRLSDTRLTTIERTRIEDEYHKRRDAIRDPVFLLSMRRVTWVRNMPKDLAQKVLNDTLATWARQADQEKGALKFKVDALSKNLLSPSILTDEYLLAVDSLRTQTNRLLRMASELSDLPGAATVRSAKDGVSLSEVRANLEDIQQYQIYPLVSTIRSEGVARNPQMVLRFVRSQVTQTGIARDATRNKVQAMERALQGYMARAGRAPDTSGTPTGGPSRAVAPGSNLQTVIPQLSDSFLDRLVEMSSQTQVADMTYRQQLTNQIIEQSNELSDLDQTLAFYQDLDRSMSGTMGTGGAAGHGQQVAAEIKRAYDALGLATDKLMALYGEFSRVSLNSTSLYVITRPFALRTQYSMSLYTAALMLLAGLVLGLVGAPIGCFIHQSVSKRGARNG